MLRGMDLESALRFCGGAARADRLLEIGVSASALRAGRRAGLVVSRGTFALPEAHPVLATAVRLGGVASHGSAAALHGWGTWREDPTIHVTVPSGSRLHEPGVRIHRAGLLRTDVDTFRPLTSPLRTVVDCARTMRLVDAVIVLDAAVHSGRVKLGSLRAAADAARGFGSAALRQAVAFVDELAASPMESVLRVLVSVLNCEVRSQVHIPGVGDVDLVLDGWLALEADGFAFHSDRRAYRKDRERANELVGQRYVLLRFTWEDLDRRRGWVLDQIANVLAAGPPQGR